jgi:hypothetical protein
MPRKEGDEPVNATDSGDADDIAWLEARELGLSELPAISTERAIDYEHLEALIAALPDEEPPTGWEAAVDAALPPDARASPQAGDTSIEAGAPLADSQARIEGLRDSTNGPVSRSRKVTHERGRVGGRWLPVVGTVSVSVGAGLLWWFHHPAEPPTEQGELSARIVKAYESRSGDSSLDGALGDVLRVEIAHPRKGELRIYRDDQEVVLRCPGHAHCVYSSASLKVDLQLTAPGRYRAVYLEPAPMNNPAGTLDADLAACDCAPRMAVPIVVR